MRQTTSGIASAATNENTNAQCQAKKIAASGKLEDKLQALERTRRYSWIFENPTVRRKTTPVGELAEEIAESKKNG